LILTNKSSFIIITQIYTSSHKQKNLIQKIPSPKITRIRRWNHQANPTPVLFYIITPKMELQYLTVDSSIRQD